MTQSPEQTVSNILEMAEGSESFSETRQDGEKRGHERPYWENLLYPQADAVDKTTVGQPWCPSRADDLAAHAQLMAESSLNQGRNNNKRNRPETLQLICADDGDSARTTKKRQKRIPSPFSSRQSPLLITQELNDFHSNEEDLARLLQEYNSAIASGSPTPSSLLATELGDSLQASSVTTPCCREELQHVTADDMGFQEDQSRKRKEVSAVNEGDGDEVNNLLENPRSTIVSAPPSIAWSPANAQAVNAAGTTLYESPYGQVDLGEELGFNIDFDLMPLASNDRVYEGAISNTEGFQTQDLAQPYNAPSVDQDSFHPQDQPSSATYALPEYRHPPLMQLAEKGGKFTESEGQKLDEFMENYQQKNHLTRQQLIDLIQNTERLNPRTKSLWDEAEETLPYRARKPIMRFCRRRYTANQRTGDFYPDEDEELKKAVAELGTSWVKVGRRMHRDSDLCRQRYRRIIARAQNQNREKWTDAEIKDLAVGVYHCLQRMKEERRRRRAEIWEEHGVLPVSESGSDDEFEDTEFIDWHVVSDQMGPGGGGRSAHQCREKWRDLKRREWEKYCDEVRQVASGLKDTPKRNKGQKSCKAKDWRVVRAKKKIAMMKAGDHYDLLQAIHNCTAISEDNIPWISLGSSEFRSMWSTLDKKTAWQMLKKKVPGSVSMYYHEIVNRLLAQLSESDLSERYDPEVHGKVNFSAKTGRKQREVPTPTARKAPYRKARMKSAPLVLDDEDSDSESEEQASSEDPDAISVTESQDRNVPTVEHGDESGLNDRSEDMGGPTEDEVPVAAGQSERESSYDSLFDDPEAS